MKRYIPFLILILLNVPCAFAQLALPEGPAMAGKVICIDPGHGGTASTDNYRKGPTGEREEWVNLRVALILRDMLEARGATVIMTRTTDTTIALADRARMAREGKADVFLSIHHNATADSAVNFPIIYFHGNASENKAGIALGSQIARALTTTLFKPQTPTSLVSDHTIFPSGGAAVLRNSYGIPAVLAEASFFSNPSEEQRLKQKDYNHREAAAYLAALEKFFQQPVAEIKPKDPANALPPFKVFQEAERMKPEARNWFRDFIEAEALMAQTDEQSMQYAYELFTRSARSFPDSYVAGKAHHYRSVLLSRMGRKEEAELEYKRFREFYYPINH